MKTLLTKPQVCELLAISDSTLERIVADGSLAAIRVRGRLRFAEEDLADYLERSRIEPTIPPQASLSRFVAASQPAPPAPRRRGRPPKAAAQDLTQVYRPGMKVVSA